MLDDEMKRCGDPRFPSQLGRLFLRGEILAAEHQAGLKFAEIYGRAAYYLGMKRTVNSPSYEADFRQAKSCENDTLVRDTADDTRKDPTLYEIRAMQAEQAIRTLRALFPDRQRWILERLCVDDEALCSSALMSARQMLQRLVLHFGTEAAPKKQKTLQRARTSVPVVQMRGKTTQQAEVNHFVSVLQGLVPELSHDGLMAAWSKFRALRDRDVYRGQKAF